MPGTTKTLSRKPLSWWERLYLPQIFVGLGVTLRNMLRRKVTLEYPDERPTIPDNYRGVPTLVKDPDGREKCVSCQLCEFVCPPKAIRIEPGEIPETSKHAHVEKAPEAFDIDMLRCIYCGLCQEVCPEEAIFLQDVYSVCGTDRKDFVFKKDQLYELGGTLPDKHFKWLKKHEAEKASSHQS